MANDKRTLIEEGTSFSGTIRSTVPVTVHGSLEGEVEAPALDIETSGSVHGVLRVGTLVSRGELSGDVDAERVQLAGAVKDNTKLRARELEVRLATEGAMQVHFGDCEIDVGPR